MGVPTSEVGYTSATTGRGDHEVQDGHVVTLDLKINMGFGVLGLIFVLFIVAGLLPPFFAMDL
jgi:hypothetical protein